MLSSLAGITADISWLSERIKTLADERTMIVRELANQGLSYAEVARSTGVSPQAVAKMAHRTVDG